MGAALCAGAFSPLGVCAEAVKTVSVDGSAQLEAFLSHVSAAEGAFRQRVVDRSGKLVNEAEGIFAFVVPALFFGIMKALEAAGRVGRPDALAL